MSKNKVEAATIEDADWSFYGDADVMDAVRRAVRHASSLFERAEADDLEHDALLHLAVRPDMIDQYRSEYEGSDFAKLLAKRIYDHALCPSLSRDMGRDMVTTPLHEVEL